ncbi:DUF6223 family protein [Streptomyces sp. NPDC007904]|uniref:DUF6223 family protein n=1 Tax=Streptomyces sp. NPDC007904 TaxID=3364787 RepID=UPI0036F06E93
MTRAAAEDRKALEELAREVPGDEAPWRPGRPTVPGQEVRGATRPAASAVPGCHRCSSGECLRPPVGTVLVVLHLATSSGGPGTDNGLVGAVVALPLGLGAVLLGRRALTGSRRTTRPADRVTPDTTTGSRRAPRPASNSPSPKPCTPGARATPSTSTLGRLPGRTS